MKGIERPRARRMHECSVKCIHRLVPQGFFWRGTEAEQRIRIRGVLNAPKSSQFFINQRQQKLYHIVFNFSTFCISPPPIALHHRPFVFSSSSLTRIELFFPGYTVPSNASDIDTSSIHPSIHHQSWPSQFKGIVRIFLFSLLFMHFGLHNLFSTQVFLVFAFILYVQQQFCFIFFLSFFAVWGGA